MIGFDIGGTKCAVTIGREAENCLEILGKKVIPTDHSVSAYEILDRMSALAIELLKGQEELADCIGISCGGPLDSARGLILSPPNLPGWDGITAVAHLEKRFGIPAFLQNDANACAVAEWLYGAGKGTKNMIFLTFGSGLGAGLILNGQLYAGTNDMAGEVGHIRLDTYGPVGYGKAGSFEGFCSGNGIAALGRILATEKLQMGQTVSYCSSMGELSEITARKIAECAKAGKEDAAEVYRLCGDKLGYGLAILIDILNPERIVIGSVFQRSEELLREAMEKRIAAESLSYARAVCKVVPAALTENIGDYAALSIAAMHRNREDNDGNKQSVGRN